MDYKELVQSMTGLREALEISHRDLCLSHAINEENLCECVLPRLEYFLVETLRCSREFLVQMQTRLFYPWLQEMTDSLSKLYVLLRNVSQRLKQLIHLFRQNGAEPPEDFATLEKQVQDYVDARLMGENPENLWAWKSLNHLKICIWLLENQENTFQLMEHLPKELTEEVINILAEKAYTEYKSKQERVRINYLEELQDELDGDLPDKHFMATKLKELRADSGPAELINLAQNYQGNWFQLIEELKEKSYTESDLLKVFLYYFKKEILFSLRNKEVKKMDLSKNEAKEKLRNSIVQLQEEKISTAEGKKEYLFNRAAHWIAVFRVLADEGVFSLTDYKAFSWCMQEIDNGTFRIPCEYATIKNITKTLYNKPFSTWHYDAVYNKKRDPFDRMVKVVNGFQQILKRNFTL